MTLFHHSFMILLIFLYKMYPANPRMSDFRNNLKHPITIEGIEVAGI